MPFQLYPKLGWITIPGTIIAAYIILGIAAIGDEIENPFGLDVNDLDMDGYVNQLAHDLIIMTSQAVPDIDDVFGSVENMPLWPYSLSGFPAWQGKEIDEIRSAARGRVKYQHVSVSRNMENMDRMDTSGPGSESV